MADSSLPKPVNAISPPVWAMLILLGSLWGGSFFFARIAVQEIQPFWLVFLRVAKAAAALHLYLVAQGLWTHFRKVPFLPFLGLGLFNNVIPFSLIFLGQTVIGAGLASILNATTPFLTVIAANVLTRDEKASPLKIAGIQLGIAGAAVIIGPSLLSGLGAPLWAELAIVGAATSHAFASIYAKRFNSLPPLYTAAGQLTVSILLMGPVALFAHGVPALQNVSTNAWLSVLALALASTAFAYTLFFQIIAEAGAPVVSLVTLLVPVRAILLGITFLGESLSINQIAGMTMIGGGHWVLNRAMGSKPAGKS
jgi:drug/metabolite transporter (DMT)-like permease